MFGLNTSFSRRFYRSCSGRSWLVPGVWEHQMHVGRTQARLPQPEFYRIWRSERARTCYDSLSFAHNSPTSVWGKPVARPGMDAQYPDLIPGRASWQAVAPWISEAPVIQSEVPEQPSRYWPSWRPFSRVGRHQDWPGALLKNEMSPA